MKWWERVRKVGKRWRIDERGEKRSKASIGYLGGIYGERRGEIKSGLKRYLSYWTRGRSGSSDNEGKHDPTQKFDRPDNNNWDCNHLYNYILFCA